MSDFFDSLYDGSLEEFIWLNGLEGGHFIKELARGGDIFAAMDAAEKYDRDWLASRAAAYEENRKKHHQPPFVGPLQLQTMVVQKTDHHDRVIGKWAEWTYWKGGYADIKLTPYEPPKRPPRHPPPRKPKARPDAFIVVRPEGSGKSSMVAELVKQKRKVVFCSKSNKQLEQQEQGFKERWPNLRIARYVSKAQNIRTVLRAHGINDFHIVSKQPASPYASQVIDKEATIQRIQEALTAVQGDPYIARSMFQHEYVDYQAPQLHGLELDVMMLTISAFQSMATSYKRAWWEELMLTTGLVEHDLRDNDGDSLGPFRSIEEARQANYRYTTAAHLKNLVVIIDDPDYTDFDWLRLIEEQQQAEDLYHRTRPRKSSTVQYWLDKGMGELTANRLAASATKQNPRGTVLYDLATVNGSNFERRPKRNTIGFGLMKGYRRSDRGRPAIKVLTTEHITAAYAEQTFKNMGMRAVVHKSLPSTDQCHVTTFSTKLVRKANHALLIPIVELLRQEFPNDDLCFIANGLNAEHNLSSTRGRNDLADRSTLIKLSIPHPTITTTLQAHFARTERTRLLHSWFLADACNQALGRNQGARWRHRVAIVLIDPMYYETTVPLLRYRRTPWSAGAEAIGGLRYHDDPTPLEWRFIELIDNAFAFGLTDEALQAVQGLSPQQQAPYLAWRKQYGRAHSANGTNDNPDTGRGSTEAAPAAADGGR